MTLVYIGLIFLCGIALGWVAHADYIKHRHARRRGGMIL